MIVKCEHCNKRTIRLGVDEICGKCGGSIYQSPEEFRMVRTRKHLEVKPGEKLEVSFTMRGDEIVKTEMKVKKENESDIVDNWADEIYEDDNFDSIKDKLRKFYKELKEYEENEQLRKNH